MATATIPGLSDQDARTLGVLRSQLASRDRANRTVAAYYEGTAPVKNLDIAVPPQLANIGVVCDWPATVVDTHHERLSFLGWKTGGRYELSRVYETHRLELLVAESCLDALVFGVGFIAVEPDQAGWAPRVVSPFDGTLLWDTATDQPAAGYRKTTSVNGNLLEVLYLTDRVIVIETSRDDPARATVVEVVPHAFGVVPMVRLRNALRSRRWYGRSLITRPVRYYTDAAARTMLAMEINREFYTTPQRYVLNAEPNIFTETDNPTRAERLRAGWEATQGRMLVVPPPQEGDPELKLGQFNAASPGPYVDQVRTYSQLMASATGIPAAYLGFATDHVPSGDSLRAWQERLVRSVEKQQRLISPDVRRLGWMLLAAADSAPRWEEFLATTTEVWASPATKTFAADIDGLSKGVQSGLFTADSDFVAERLGLSRSDVAKNKRALALAEVQKNLDTRAKRKPGPDKQPGGVVGHDEVAKTKSQAIKGRL